CRRRTDDAGADRQGTGQDITMSIGLIFLAFGAGLLSFLSPCVLPLVPIYIGYLSGAAATPQGIVVARRDTLSHALAFVLGFTTIFIALGSALFALSDLIGKLTLAHIAGVILVIFGINMLGIIKIPFLYQEARMQVTMQQLGYPRSFLTGMAFAAGWTPCVGPMLSLILGLSLQTATTLEGTGLLLLYSAGLGVPFMLTALALEKMTGRLKSFNRYLHAIEIASGILLIGVGLLLVFDQFQVLNAYFFQLTPSAFFQLEQNLANLLGVKLAQ
ncbi:MAG: cytochrome c biogenesis protein CcdA, partial [Anaerolineae bacterium]